MPKDHANDEFFRPGTRVEIDNPRRKTEFWEPATVLSTTLYETYPPCYVVALDRKSIATGHHARVTVSGHDLRKLS